LSANAFVVVAVPPGVVTVGVRLINPSPFEHSVLLGGGLRVAGELTVSSESLACRIVPDPVLPSVVANVTAVALESPVPVIMMIIESVPFSGGASALTSVIVGGTT
jgi:hypothetical protein